MVHVVPPMGWNSTTVEPRLQDPAVWPPTRESSPAAPRPAKTKAKAAAVIPPALPPRPAPAQPPAVAASPASTQPPPVLAAAKIAGQPPLPTLAASAAAVPPPVPAAVAIGSIDSNSVDGTSLTATRWTALTNWARQEWKFLTAGVGAGIALGGSVWLVLAMQAPSAPVVAGFTNNSSPPVAKAPESSPQAAAATLAGEAPAVPVTAVEKASASKDLPTEPTDKRGGKPQNPIATTAPIATAPLDKPAPVDKPKTTGLPQAEAQPIATDEKTPPVASTPRPTIKLEPVPAASAAATQTPEVASTIDRSIIDTGAADESHDTPAVVRTPATESPGAERSALTAAEVDERLSRALPAAQFTKVPLFKFIEFVAELTGLPIQLDEPALKRAGKSRQSAVTIKLNETTAGDALRAALSDLGLVTTLRSGVVIVTVASDAQPAK